MSDFKKSLLAGLAAAKQTEANKEEISEVIADLSFQVEQVSHARARFGITTSYRELGTLELAARTMTDVLSRVPQRVSYTAFIISNSKGEKGIEIAQWEQGANGYPCTIRYGAQKFVCSNKTELENSLAALMQESKVGEAILRQINAHDESIHEENGSD